MDDASGAAAADGSPGDVIVGRILVLLVGLFYFFLQVFLFFFLVFCRLVF